MVRRRKPRNELVVYDAFNIMDVVFVKIRGFVPWPSQIREIYENRLYFVEYFGSRWTECEWVNKNKLSPIGPLENNPIARKHAKHKEFMEAWDYGRNILDIIRNTEEAQLSLARNEVLQVAHQLPLLVSLAQTLTVDSGAIENEAALHSIADDPKHKMKHCVVVLNRMPVSNASTSISAVAEEKQRTTDTAIPPSGPAEKKLIARKIIEPPSMDCSVVALESVNKINRCVVVLNRLPLSAVSTDEQRRIIAVARKSVVRKEKSERSAPNIRTVAVKAKKRVNALKLIESSPPPKKRSKRTQRAPNSSTQK